MINVEVDSNHMIVYDSDDTETFQHNTDIEQEYCSNKLSLVPVKSRKHYERAYNDLKKWCTSKNFDISKVDEDVLIVYFNDLALIKKRSTLWSLYSKIRSTLMTQQNINIKEFKILLELIKKYCSSDKTNPSSTSSTSKQFTREQIEFYLNTAPDETHLLTKVATIIAVSGSCRLVDLINIQVDHVIQDLNSNIIITIKDEITNKCRSFPIITHPYIDLIIKYRDLRPPYTPHNRFFVFYYKGKCTKQPIGKNKFGQLAVNIAKFLVLKNPESYTATSFRKTSAIL